LELGVPVVGLPLGDEPDEPGGPQSVTVNADGLRPSKQSHVHSDRSLAPELSLPHQQYTIVLSTSYVIIYCPSPYNTNRSLCPSC